MNWRNNKWVKKKSRKSHVSFWQKSTDLQNWRRKWQPTPELLPGKSHGGRSMVGYSPWGRKELDTTNWLHFHFHYVAKVWPIGKVSLCPSLTRTFLICICWPSKITENVPIHSYGGYENIPFISSTAESIIDQWLLPPLGSSTRQRKNIAMGRFRGKARRIHHFCLPFIGHNSMEREM